VTPWPVSVAFPLALAGAIVLILVYDLAAAAYARAHPSFRHGNLWPLQFGLYVVIGFFAMLAVLDLRLVQSIGAITGFVEATLGWAIAWRFGVARIANPSFGNIALVVASMTAFGFGLAIAGALLFNVAARAVLRPGG
jgi:hypothetical protein